MSQINRRNFLLTLSGASIITVIGQKEVSAQVKNFKMTSPVHGYEYTHVGGPIEFRVNFRRRQSYPKISRIDYRSGGVLIGSGFPNANQNQNFYFAWSIPIPSLQGDSYTVTAEAIQARTGNILSTDTASFRVVRLLG